VDLDPVQRDLPLSYGWCRIVAPCPFNTSIIDKVSGDGSYFECPSLKMGGNRVWNMGCGKSRSSKEQASLSLRKNRAYTGKDGTRFQRFQWGRVRVGIGHTINNFYELSTKDPHGNEP